MQFYIVLEPLLESILTRFLVCWTYYSTRYRAIVGPPINVKFHAWDVYTSAWGCWKSHID